MPDRPSLGDIFGVQDDRPPLAAIFGAGPDFSDVTGSASSTADPGAAARKRALVAALTVGGDAKLDPLGPELAPDQAALLAKRAQMAQARQIAAAQGLAGPAPAQGTLDRLSDFGANVVSGAKSGTDFIAHIPDLLGGAVASVPVSVNAAVESNQRRQRLFNAAGDEEAFSSELQRQAATPIPQAQGGSILPDIVEETFQSARDERERNQARTLDREIASGASPDAASLAFAIPATVGNLLDPTVLMGTKGLAARAENAFSEGLLDRMVPGMAPGLAERGAATLPSGVESLAEAAYLARRAEALRSMPGATEAPLRPGAIADAMQPERSILQVGEHADNLSQDVALGLRARPEDAADAAELAGQSLALDEHAAPSLPRQEPPSLAEIFGEPPTQESELRFSRGPAENVGPRLGAVEDVQASVPVAADPSSTPPILRNLPEIGGGDPPSRGLVVAGIGNDGRAYLGQPGDIHVSLPERYPGRAPWKNLGLFADSQGNLLSREEALAAAEVPVRPSANMDGGLDALDYQDAVRRAGGQRVAPPSPVPYTGTTQAIIEGEQRAAGLPVSERLASQGPAWDEAARIIEQDPEAPRRLAQEVATSPRPVSDVERHMLLQDRARLRPTYYAAMDAEEAALASGDQAQAAVAKAHRLAVEDAYQTNADAAHHASSEWGKSGNAAQQLAAEDYSAPELVRRYRLANLGEEAPDPVRKKLVEISRQLEDAHARLAVAEEKAQNLEAQRMVYNEAQNAAREVRSKGRAAVQAGLDQEYAGLQSEWRKATGLAQAGVNPDQAVILAKMARNRVRAGVTNVQDVIDGVFQDARPHLDTLEPQDVRDAIAGAGPVAQKEARKAAVSDFGVLRREARVLNALDGAHANLAAAGDARATAAAQKEITRWEAELAKIQGGARLGGGPLSDAQRIKASLSRNAARQAELREQIASGTIIPRGRAPVANGELIAARAETQRLQQQADAIIAKRELQNRSWFQKGLDLWAAASRFVPLTSTTGTLPKLAAAAGSRSLVFRPAEQLLSFADPYLPLLREFSAEAPVEGGGVGLNALKKSYQGFFSKEAADEALAHLKGQEGPFALAHGHARMPSGAPAFMDYPGHVHAAVKSPTVIAGYNWAMETQAAALRRAGTEITPQIAKEMDARAWETALRDILLEKNGGIDRFNEALDKRAGDSRSLRFGIAATRSQLPIVKVPVNYVKQLTDYIFGLPKAGVGMADTLLKGNAALKASGGARTLESLVREGLKASPPGYADYIMRNLKRGRLGAALAGLVMGGAVEVGGYYRKGEHRGPNDLQPGEIRIHGVPIQLPHNLLHSGPIEAMQVVGTFKRSPDFYTGLKTSGLGVAEQVPFIEETQRVGRDLPNNPAKFVGMGLRQITEPPDAQKLARVLDQSEPRTTAEKIGQAAGLAGLKLGPIEVPEIKARKRTPRGGFWEQLWKQEELGIPGLRDNVR